MKHRRTTRAIATTLVVGTAVGVLPAWALLSAERSYPGNQATSEQRSQQLVSLPVEVPVPDPLPAPAPAAPLLPPPQPVAPRPVPAEPAPAPQPPAAQPEPAPLLPPAEVLELLAFLAAQQQALTPPPAAEVTVPSISEVSPSWPDSLVAAPLSF